MDTFERLANPWVSGLAIYEPGLPIEEVARELGIEDVESIVKLASNENALGPSPKAVEAMRAAAAGMHRYPDGGCFYLRRALGEQLGVDPGQVLPGTGSNELIEFIGHAFLDPESNIVMADRAFVVYRLVAMAARAETIRVPMRDHTHDLPAMAAAVTGDTKVVFVANPNNPTGTMVDQDAIDRFMDKIGDGVIVCFDEAYIELLEPEQRPDTLKYVREERPVIVLRTFSKAYGLAGLRIGYAIAPQPCIALLNRVRQPFNVNAMAQAGALAALDDDAHLERSRRMMRDGIAQLEAGLKAMDLPFIPTVANFMMVRTGEGRAWFQRLQHEGIIARPMDGYGMPEYIRVTVGTADENARLLEALAKLKGRDGKAS